MRQAPLSLSVSVIESVEGLRELEEDWRALHRRLEHSTPFQSPDWLLPLLSHQSPSALLSIAIFHDRRLIALAPLEVEQRDSVRVLRLVGGAVTDYLDVLIDPDQPHAINAVLETLDMLRDRWAQASFEQLPNTSPLLQAPLPTGWSEERDSRETCPSLPLPPHGPSPMDLEPSLWRRIRYLRRRIARDHGVAFVDWREVGVDVLLDALFNLHGARWGERGQSGVLAQGWIQQFHRDVAARFAASDSLLLYGLRMEGRWVSVIYGLADDVRHALYISGFDPAWERVSPGRLLVAHAMEKAIEAGVREFDFLRGDEPYKYAWGARDLPLYQRRCGPGDVR